MNRKLLLITVTVIMVSSSVTLLAKENGCVAAPVIAGGLLDEANIVGQAKGYFISLVAAHMGEGATFNGVDKCNVKAYELEIAIFLKNAGADVDLPSYEIGETGPGGGVIFYIDEVDAFPWTYLEAAPIDIVNGGVMLFEWSNVNNTFVGFTGREIGKGQANTQYIIAQPAHIYSAAKQCDDLILGGYSDWFLPSQDELNMMYLNLYLHGLGGLWHDGYWSSYDVNDNFARAQYFGDGHSGTLLKSVTFRVRAVRSF